MNKLPKTRSGKILRRVIKKIINEESYQAPGTIEDISLLKNFEEISISKKFEQVVLRPD